MNKEWWLLSKKISLVCYCYWQYINL